MTQRHVTAFVAAFVVVVAACASPGPSSERGSPASAGTGPSFDATAGGEGVTTSNVTAPVEALTSIVRGVTKGGGAVLLARLDGDPVERIPRAQVGRYFAVFGIHDVSVLWAPTDEAARKAADVVSVNVNLSEAGENWLVGGGPDAEVLVVWNLSGDATSLISLAADDRAPDPEFGRLRLSVLMRSLRTAALSRPAYPDCSLPETPPVGSSDAEVLVAHIEAIERTLVLNRQAGKAEELADRLSDELATVDVVTGLEVMADTNDLVRQLRLGVAEKDLVPRRVVPILFDFRSFGDGATLAYFVADGEVLGFTSVSRVPDLVLADLPLPRTRKGIEVWLSPTGVDACGELGEDATLVMTIPYDTAGGDTTRALVDFSANQATALTGAEFLELVNRHN